MHAQAVGLTDLTVELRRRLDTMEDFHADTRLLGFYIDGHDAAWEKPQLKKGEQPPVRNVTMTIDLHGEEPWSGPVNDHAQDQIGGRLGLPRHYWDRMRDRHPDILVDTVTRLFNRESEVRLMRTLDHGVRAFLSNKYAPRDNYDLMDKAVLPAISESRMEVRSCALTDTRMYVKVLFPDVQTEVKQGDIVQAGVIVSNSEVGAGSTTVEPFLYRLICTNGMIAPIAFSEFGLRKHHVGRRIGGDADTRALFSERSLQLEDEAFFSIVYDVVKGAAGGVAFARMVDRLKDLAGLRVEGDPVQVVERIARTQRFTEPEQGTIMQHLIEGGDLSAYGYMNAVTRAAQDVPGYDRSVDMERVGGNMLAWSDKAWRDLLNTPLPNVDEAEQKNEEALAIA